MNKTFRLLPICVLLLAACGTGAAAQLAPNNYDAQIWLANAYQAAGQTNEATAAYMRAARLRRPVR